MEYTVEEIQKAYEKSSAKIKDILDDVWVANTCGEIGRELNLRIDKIDNLIRIVGLTLLNIISINDFVKVVEEELEVSNPNATTISKKVDELIFTKVREIIVSDGDNTFVDNLEKEVDDKEVIRLIDDIEKKADDNLSFKDKFNKVTVKKAEERIVDPYREAID